MSNDPTRTRKLSGATGGFSLSLSGKIVRRRRGQCQNKSVKHNNAVQKEQEEERRDSKRATMPTVDFVPFSVRASS